MITIGLAGHIDHGKSSLVRRLTGVDPDRLPEEKARGMTIDLGFAHWSPSGASDSHSTVSFVDVPGHERFVRNMIAGAGGIEAALLVVAADDGWMPQSQEHFDIMRLLDIKRGIIAVTKIDIADKEWLSAVIEDIKEHVAASFLHNAPIVPVSSTTGEGFPELKRCLAELSHSADIHHDIGKPRLAIDRSFVLTGIGGVVTGSARDGGFSQGDEIAVAPSGITGKIRTLHHHERQVERVSAGQRTALSFTGIDKSELNRGAFVTTPELGNPALNGRVALVRLETLPDTTIRLSHRRKLLMFLGAAEIPCEIRAPGGAELPVGGAMCVALRCDEAPFCFVGDRFVLRLPTPQVTVGGGIILGWRKTLPHRAELKRQIQLTERYFNEAIPDSGEALRRLIALQLELRFPQAQEDILLRSIYSQTEIRNAIKELVHDRVVFAHESLLYPSATLDMLLNEFIERIGHHFSESPHLKGLTRDEALRLLPDTYLDRLADTATILNIATERQLILAQNGLYRLPGRELTVSGTVRKEAERILAELQANPFSPPLIAKLVVNGKVSKDALGFLLNTEQAVKVNSDLTLNSEAWSDILRRIRQRLYADEEVTVAWLRSELDTSRKYALPILEELDKRSVTERVGDKRIKGCKFDSYFKSLEK